MKLILFLALLINSLIIDDAEAARRKRRRPSSSSNSKVIYKYKTYEKFDLSEINVDGKIFAPSDFTVIDRSTRRFDRKIYNRSSFRDKIKDDIRNLR